MSFKDPGLFKVGDTVYVTDLDTDWVGTSNEDAAKKLVGTYTKIVGHDVDDSYFVDCSHLKEINKVRLSLLASKMRYVNIEEFIKVQHSSVEEFKNEVSF